MNEIRRRLCFTIVAVAALILSAPFMADQGLRDSGAAAAVLAESGISSYSSHTGPGADFDKSGTTTRVFTVGQAEPFVLPGPFVPGGGVVVDVVVSWNWLTNDAPPTDTITINGTSVTGAQVGTGSPDLCWGKASGASYVVSLGPTGFPVVLNGAGNTIAGATDTALGTDPDAYGEGLHIVVIFDVPANPLRSVDVYAGYTSTESGTGSATLTFSNAYNGGPLHFFVNALDGQVTGAGEDLLVNGSVVTGTLPGTGPVGDAWQGYLGPLATDSLYDQGNGDVAATATLGDTQLTLQTITGGDCIGHTLAAVSFEIPPDVPASSNKGLLATVLALLIAIAVVPFLKK